MSSTRTNTRRNLQGVINRLTDIKGTVELILNDGYTEVESVNNGLYVFVSGLDQLIELAESIRKSL